MRSHLGTRFTVWSRRWTWFWLVLNQHGNGGVVGTAATEAEAIRDACSSIEEMSVQVPSHCIAPGRADGNALIATSNRAYLCNAPTFGWIDWWISIAHRITDRMLVGWAEFILRSN